MTQPNPCASWKRSLAIVWIGEFFSVLTSSILQMGLIWHVTLTTGSASALSFVSLAAFLPMALLGAFAGTIVDRTSIKRLMIGADLFIAAVSLTLVFGSLRGDLSVAVVAAVLFVRALGSTLHTPAFNALTPLIAPPEVLGKLAGMLQFMQSGSYIIGNAIAAAVYPAFGLTFMIALDVAGAVLASIAVATSGIKTPAPERHTPEENAEASHRAVRAFLLETANGYRELKRHHGLFAMLWIGFAFSVLFSPISALFPLMVFDHFGGTTTQSAIAEIAFSVGMIAASGWIGRRVALRTARFRARWPSASSERARSRAASCPLPRSLCFWGLRSRWGSRVRCTARRRWRSCRSASIPSAWAASSACTERSAAGPCPWGSSHRPCSRTPSA